MLRPYVCPQTSLQSTDPKNWQFSCLFANTSHHPGGALPHSKATIAAVWPRPAPP